jgi:hypothetical protein
MRLCCNACLPPLLCCPVRRKHERIAFHYATRPTPCCWRFPCQRLSPVCRAVCRSISEAELARRADFRSGPHRVLFKYPAWHLSRTTCPLVAAYLCVTAAAAAGRCSRCCVCVLSIVALLSRKRAALFVADGAGSCRCARLTRLAAKTSTTLCTSASSGRTGTSVLAGVRCVLRACRLPAVRAEVRNGFDGLSARAAHTTAVHTGARVCVGDHCCGLEACRDRGRGAIR